MFTAGMSVTEQQKQLQTALGLDWDDQDWGIVNADASRVAEFVSFFEQNHDEHWTRYTIEAYVDLVLESASDAVLEDPDFSADCVDSFVARVALLARDRLEYWTSNDWPIAPHLRALGL